MSDKISDQNEFLLKLFSQITTRVNKAKAADLAQLTAMAQKSYTAFLVKLGCEEIGKKLLEESFELSLAALEVEKYNGHKQRIMEEAADVIYHLMVLLAFCDVKFEQVIDKLEERQKAVDNDQTKPNAKLTRKAKKKK